MVVCLFFVCGSPALAGWEHAPVSETTRLAPGQDTWEFGLVYTLEAMYPARFVCPAGVRVVFHALNLSRISIQLERRDTHETIWLPPGAYRRWDFGRVAPGDHVFELIMSMSADAAHAHSGVQEPDRLLCRLHAGTWPGDSLPFEAAWVETAGRLLPARLALPAGRPVSLFVGASAKARRERIPAQDQLLQVKPAEVTLTEFARPRGGRTEIPLPSGQPAVLDVR